MKRILFYCSVLISCAAYANTQSIHIPIDMVDASGAKKAIGTIAVQSSPYGLLFTPALTDMPPGVHGFHIHEKPSCAPGMKEGKAAAALSAGGHWDPQQQAKHEGPYGSGHLGDLPALYVNEAGVAQTPVLAPRLTSLGDLHGHSVMIHAGGDNHSDHPAALGGGGARLACGVID